MSNTNVIFKHRTKASDCPHVVTIRTTRKGNFLVTAEGEALRYGVHGYTMPCELCGKTLVGVSVDGKTNAAHECNAKCMSSTGPSCSCSCGGANHGAAYA